MTGFRQRFHAIPRGRLLLLGFLTVVIGFALAFAVAEIALRLLPIPGITYHSFRYNERTGGSYYPNTTIVYRNARGDHVRRRSNSWGFLDKEHDVAKPEGITRIGFFGDSYTEAKQVPLSDTFYRRIEDRLNEGGERYECLAFGASGYGTLQSYLESQEWMPKLDLDYVVYVFVENDPGDQIREIKRSDAIPSAHLEDGELVIDNSFRERYAYKKSPLHRAAQYLKARSLVISTVEGRLKLLKQRGIKMRVTEADMQMAETVGANEIPNQNVPPGQWPDSLRSQAAQVGEAILSKWAGEVRAAGHEFAVIYIPRENELGKPIEEQDSWASWLFDVCRRNDIDIIDPSAQFTSAIARGSEIFYDHFTPTGHAALTDAFIEYFQQVVILRTGEREPEHVSTLANPSRPGASEPNIHADANGRVYLSWTEPVDEGHRLRYATLQRQGWGNPRTIAQGSDWFVNWADFPSLVTSGEVMAAHWLVKSGDGPYAYDVHIALSGDGGANWSPAIVPHDDGTQTEHGFVSMVPWPDGRVLVVWLDGRKMAADSSQAQDEHHGDMTLRGAIVTTTGTLSDEQELDSRVCECCQTSAVAVTGGAVAVYRDRSPEEIRDISVVRYIDGRWERPRIIHNEGWKIEGCPVNGPAVAATGAQVAVAYFTMNGSTPRVKIAFSRDAGRTFARPAAIDNGNPMGRVDLAWLDHSSVVVSWMERVGETAEVRVRRVMSNGAAGPVQTVAGTTSERASGFPRLALAGGDVYVAWMAPGTATPVRTARVTIDRRFAQE